MIADLLLVAVIAAGFWLLAGAPLPERKSGWRLAPDGDGPIVVAGSERGEFLTVNGLGFVFDTREASEPMYFMTRVQARKVAERVAPGAKWHVMPLAKIGG